MRRRGYFNENGGGASLLVKRRVIPEDGFVRW